LNNLERWNAYLDSIESPQIFVDWTLYLTISAALQRRVCIGGLPNQPVSFQHFPNMYVVFIAPPAIGKTIAASAALDIFRQFTIQRGEETEKEMLIKTGPSSITTQALFKYLATHYTTTDLAKIKGGELQKGKVYLHASLAFFCGSELGNLLEKDSEGLVAFLTEAWEGRDFIRETKTQGTDVIKKLCVTLLGAATPEWIRQAISNKLLKQGFSSRTIFLYADQPRKRTAIYETTPEQQQHLVHLREHIRQLTELYGEVKLSPEARAWYIDWYEQGGYNAINKDKRLADYYGRKKLHLLKLAMAIHFSDSLSMTMEVGALQEALRVLGNAEISMHKALSFGGENPVYDLALTALQLIDTTPNKRMSFNQLYLALFDNGSREEIDAALQFLCDTEQLTATAGMKGLLYAKK